MSLMVSISGIRGIVGETLTPDVVVKYAAAFAEYSHGGTIVVGRDGRVTGKNIESIVTSTLLQMGCRVISLGICPTPTVGLAIEKFHAAGGISITASHNPMMWNGLKFMGASGMFLNGEENKTFWQIADRGNFPYRPWEKQGTLEQKESFLDDHLQSILDHPYLHIDSIKKRKLKIVVDCVNAAGGVIVPPLLRALGCTVIEMNCDVSGIFSHTPEPIPENLKDLSQRVAAEKADLGIAVDPDVDRLVLINEKGEPFVEEYTIVSAVKFVLESEKKKGNLNHSVVVNLSTTRAVEDVAALYGATVYRTPVGEINVASAMRDHGSVIGGEGSGGVILPSVHLGRDAIVGIGLFLQLFVDFNGKASSLKASFPQYEIVKDKIAVGSKPSDTILQTLHAKYSKTEKTNFDDGLKIDFPTSWVHLRKSNTEPIIRIIAEATTRHEASTLVDKFKKEVAG